MHKLAELRREYAMASLDITNVSKDPIEQFNKWFDEVLKSEALEPNAMSLATVGQDNKPSCRIVLLKGIENDRFTFYTNYQSHKGKELEDNPVCALTFFWPELERQVRIEGNVSRLDEHRSQEYFQSRPLASQVSAWSSPQSLVIKSREILEERVKKIEERFTGLTVLPKPKQWGGYQVDPVMIESWQGRKSRLHDRSQFMKVGKRWQTNRLAP
ncbi:MAG TPA: pyridoxamine 5'-phosphate oxidase [Chryseolinea sp.]|nr:pyridoxamine 5'-phosphate oxidase [Chryseolinea sp.]